MTILTSLVGHFGFSTVYIVKLSKERREKKHQLFADRFVTVDEKLGFYAFPKFSKFFKKDFCLIN